MTNKTKTVQEKRLSPGSSRCHRYPHLRAVFTVNDYGHLTAFSMERAACKLFGVVTYGVHMTVYEQQKGDVRVDANGVRVWVPRRAATKPTCVHHVYISRFLLSFFLYSRSRVIWGLSPPRRSHSFMIIIFFGYPACVCKAIQACSTTRSQAVSRWDVCVQLARKGS